MDFTFLTEDQIWGRDALDVISRYGTKVEPTDLAVLLGGSVMLSDNVPSCPSWSASLDGHGIVRCVDSEGNRGWGGSDERRIAARPALSQSEFFRKIKWDSDKTYRDSNEYYVTIYAYGEYPQTVADYNTREKLERMYAAKSLRPTGKQYTFDSVDIDDHNTPLKAVSYKEYRMGDERYIRIPGRPADKYCKLSTDEQVEAGKTYWVKVEPIEWMMDRSGIMVAKKCLFAGIQFDTDKDYDGDFSKSFMKHYLDTYFAKEMEPIERMASREASKNIENSDMITSKMSLLRAVVAPNISDNEVTRKMPKEEKRKRLDAAIKALQSVKVKDITD